MITLPRRELPRRDTFENWLKENPIIEEGHVIWITDSQVSLIGDGESSFSKLYRNYNRNLRAQTRKVTYK